MFIHAAVAIFQVIGCNSYAEYDMFNGFDENNTAVLQSEQNTYTPDVSKSTITSAIPTNLTTFTTLPTTDWNATTLEPNVTLSAITTPRTEANITTRPRKKYVCPEDVKPKNLGSYEIPSKRDLVILTKNVLQSMYDAYSQESLILLNDIKEATKAALVMESKCNHNKRLYRQCVKRVSKRCEQITKHLHNNVEAQRFDVLALTEETICSLEDMKANPLNLIKLLAQERSMLEFQFAGFLRFISACEVHCYRPNNNNKISMKSLKRLTDQDLVVRHFLNKKNYIQLINDSNHTAFNVM
ncbi:uncharacterized protein LOC126970973 isoform X3 [Leptidea sinapis]|uniref:uncharacterized protein LOC126970973 isoform X3 n=1 Tax=Leptidea sinapis TaxID=189913 RepID=UPI0021C2BD1D|nr:uncharacterized protein LOC126970973 isoform X3 [Leptidea sinapis]